MTPAFHSARPGWTLLITAIFVTTLVAIAVNPLRIGWDQAMYLQAGDLLLHHYVPYVDIVDLNPPLIMYVNAVPAAIALAIDQHPIPVFLVFIWALSVASTFATRRLLAEVLPFNELNAADWIATALAVVPLLFLYENAYGQREHLFICGFFPYLIVRFRRWRDAAPSPRVSIATGACAGLVACLKPHFAAIALAPEIYWVATRRRVRPLFRAETIAAAAVAVVYIAHFVFVPAAMREAFLGNVVPLVARGYHVYDSGLRVIVLGEPLLWLPAVLAPLALLLPQRTDSVAWTLAPPLVAVTTMSGIVFVLQDKGWMYQAIPVAAGAATLIALVASRFWRGSTAARATASPWQRACALGLGVIVVAAMLAIPRTTVTRLTGLAGSDPLAQTIVASTGIGDPVLMIATDAGSAYPLLAQLRRTPGSRFLFFFPIPMLYDGVSAPPGRPFPYRGTASAPMPAREAKMLGDLRADVQSRQPSLVLVERGEGCQGCPAGFNVADYLEHTSFTATALAPYHRTGVVEGLDVYVRNEQSAR